MTKCANKDSSVVLSNVVPFNEFFYYSCFYTMLFTAVQLLNKSVYPYMINLLSYYSLYYDEKRLGLYINVENIKDLVLFSNEQGVNTKCKIYTPKLKDDIIQALENNHPVIVSINCFYESLREEFYLKKDWRHSLLVYGFDMNKNLFYIVEHDHIDSPVYQQRKIDMDELCRSYEGYIQVFQKPDEYTFFELSSVSEAAYTEKYWRALYAKNQFDHLAKLKNGLTQILNMKEIFHERIAEKHLNLRQNIEDMLNGVNNIITFKKGQLYLLNHLYRINDELTLKLQNIIDLWTSIRLNLAKYLYSKRNNDTNLYDIINKLQDVYNLENESLQLIIKRRDIRG